MAIKIDGQTVITDGRKGKFRSNPARTPQQIAQMHLRVTLSTTVTSRTFLSITEPSGFQQAVD